MPIIALSDLYDAKLKALVTEPFVDTRESIVQRLIDEELARRGTALNGHGYTRSAPDNHRRLNPDSPENLRFTRVLSAAVGGQELNRPNWNKVLDHLHVVGLRQLGAFDALERATGAHIAKGRRADRGYRYVAEADLSIQGVESNVAWMHSLRLARALGVPIKLTIEWRKEEDAANPGETAVLEWAPKDN